MLNTDDSDDLHVTFYSETDRTDLDGTVNGEQQCQILRHLILLLCLLFTMCVVSQSVFHCCVYDTFLNQLLTTSIVLA